MAPHALPVYSTNIVIKRNQDFYAFAPVYLIFVQFDPNVWYPVDIDDETFGNAVLESLAASESIQKSFNEANYEERVKISRTDEAQLRRNGKYGAWVLNTMEKFGYKTRKKMFQRMVDCSVRDKDGMWEAQIHEHDKMEAWSGALETYTFDKKTTSNSLGQCLRNAIDNVFSEDLF